MTIEKQNAQAYYMRHDKYSWAQFLITDKGDLFINSDWGTFGTAWRSFGKDFKDFLISINTDYLIGNLETNVNMTIRGSKPYRIRGERATAIAELFKEFQKCLQEEKLVTA